MTSPYARVVSTAALLVVVSSPAAAADPPKLAPVGEVAEFARTHCLSCHSATNAAGGFDLDDLLKGPNVGANAAGWHAALERIASRDMPPRKAKIRPTEAEYRAAEDWVRKQLQTHEAIAAAARPRPLRRLNRDEYNRTVQAVFGLPDTVRPADDFPPDDAVDGFTNVAEGLNLSAVLVDQYLAAGEKVARLAITDGPQPASKIRKFALGSKDYGSTFRGHDPGGAVSNGKWVGDHLYIVFDGPPGFYQATLTASAKNWASRPGYIPNVQYRANGRIVYQADTPVKDAAVLQSFVFAHTAGGSVNFDFRWVNGFPDNNGLRAKGLPLPGWPAKEAHNRLGVWNYLHYEYEPAKKKDPNTPYPFPYFEEAKLEIEGPLFPEGWPLSRFQRETAEAMSRKDAKAVAEWLLPRLYRRPAKADEVSEFVTFVARAEARLGAATPPVPADKRFPEAVRQAVARSLASPHFLFLVEPGPVGRPLTDLELATRLSYFLWAAPPDEELARLAAAGKLRPALAAQAKRMIADPRSKAFVERFTTEWLGLDRLATIMPEPDLYPRFDAQGLLRQDMAAEPKAMVGHLLSTNGSLYDLLEADYTFLNDRLADHYHLPSLWSMFPLTRDGFTPVSGGEFRMVKLPDGRRGGLVTTAAALALTSENSRTSPVKRGVWVLEKLYNRTPPPPPPNVNGVLPDTTTGTTAAEKLKLHRNAPNCAGCHARIDPFGVALENFDAIGEWRDREPPHIDPASPATNMEAVRARLKLGKYDPLPTFPIDATFRMGDFEGDGVAAVKKYLVANKDKFARGFTEKLTTYALGRRPLITDEAALEKVRASAAADGFRFQNIIVALVESPIFQSR